jgi:hypothetical protein
MREQADLPQRAPTDDNCHGDRDGGGHARFFFKVCIGARTLLKSVNSRRFATWPGLRCKETPS